MKKVFRCIQFNTLDDIERIRNVTNKKIDIINENLCYIYNDNNHINKVNKGDYVVFFINIVHSGIEIGSFKDLESTSLKVVEVDNNNIMILDCKNKSHTKYKIVKYDFNNEKYIKRFSPNYEFIKINDYLFFKGRYANEYKRCKRGDYLIIDGNRIINSMTKEQIEFWLMD